jgi:hypothetical protein
MDGDPKSLFERAGTSGSESGEFKREWMAAFSEEKRISEDTK